MELPHKQQMTLLQHLCAVQVNTQEAETQQVAYARLLSRLCGSP